MLLGVFIGIIGTLYLLMGLITYIFMATLEGENLLIILFWPIVIVYFLFKTTRGDDGQD